eukprot:COSAG01_NODE_1561_length_9917_cov_5.742514_3_plen_227_part_00
MVIQVPVPEQAVARHPQAVARHRGSRAVGPSLRAHRIAPPAAARRSRSRCSTVWFSATVCSRLSTACHHPGGTYTISPSACSKSCSSSHAQPPTHNTRACTYGSHSGLGNGQALLLCCTHESSPAARVCVRHDGRPLLLKPLRDRPIAAVRRVAAARNRLRTVRRPPATSYAGQRRDQNVGSSQSICRRALGGVPLRTHNRLCTHIAQRLRPWVTKFQVHIPGGSW